MIDKTKIFPQNDLFNFNTDNPAVNRVEDKIRHTELAIKYTRQTVGLHQNKKNLIRLEKELKRQIFNYNKFDLFNVLSAEMDKSLMASLRMEYQ
jgi:hypothetical protein